jgi:hypothetical protein
MKPQESLPAIALPPLPPAGGITRLRLLAGVLPRLGMPALVRYARHRLRAAVALPPDAVVPDPPFLHADASSGGGADWFGPSAAWRDAPALAVPTAGPFDIRLLWEAGRLVDLPSLAARDPAAAEAMVRDFVRANPPFRGPHWACGQEASIRLVHLLAAHEATGRTMLPGFRALVALHRTRIAATLDYAMAQDNNHAISEAAGLWAASLALGDAAGAARGRALLERAVMRLFAPTGGFSQQSTRYHVVALEMAAFAERFSGAQGGQGLSEKSHARLAPGVDWLTRITDPESGRAWRVGPDDGSRFFNAPPNDVRPTLRRAAAVLRPPPLPGRVPNPGGVRNPAPQGGREQDSWLDADGGFAGLRQGDLRAFLRLPVHRFRPGQADALHLDLWHDSACLLGDGGTALYNFNADPAAPDLGRTAAHNTIAFDDDDQMPRLSRFLYAAWLQPLELAAEPGRMLGAYRDWKGRFHRREVRLVGHAVTVEDRFDGGFTHATARFRLPDGAWCIDGDTLRGEPLTIAVEGAARLRLVRLPFAPEYGRWTTTPALEVTADRPGRLACTITVAPEGHSA